jgi:hypothetical protein
MVFYWFSVIIAEKSGKFCSSWVFTTAYNVHVLVSIGTALQTLLFVDLGPFAAKQHLLVGIQPVTSLAVKHKTATAADACIGSSTL